MANGPTPIETGLGEIWRQGVVNLGAATPTSLGEGEVMNAFMAALLGFRPPSVASYLAPATATAETFPRNQTNTVAIAETSGVLLLTAIAIPANTVVNTINFVSGTTAATGPTHQWGALYNASRGLLAISADGTSTAIAASTVIPFAVANTAAGAASSFTTTYTGLYYVGVLTTSSSAQPTWAGLTGTATENDIVPILTGTSTGSLTTPSTFPTTAGAITGTATSLYAYLT